MNIFFLISKKNGALRLSKNLKSLSILLMHLMHVFESSNIQKRLVRVVLLALLFIYWPVGKMSFSVSWRPKSCQNLKSNTFLCNSSSSSLAILILSNLSIKGWRPGIPSPFGPSVVNMNMFHFLVVSGNPQDLQTRHWIPLNYIK